MWNLPKRVVEVVADATLGTAIVMAHVLFVQRQRERQRLARGGTDDHVRRRPSS